MYRHHEDTIQNVIDKFERQSNVLALLLSGSIAHGFETERSDVDIMILVSDDEYEVRKARDQLTHWEVESCTYDGGYVDGKYISPSFLRLVAQRGSEPARFAFEGARVLFSRIDGIAERIAEIAAYPVDEKQSRMKHFYAHLKAWRWYAGEALSHNNDYLLHTSVSNLLLFGGRLLLAYNETLYPYHKWFLHVLERVPQKPDGLMESIHTLLQSPTQANIDRFCDSILPFADWGFADFEFANHFLRYSEQNWIDGMPPIADL